MVEDDFHAEWIGKFATRSEAEALLERLRANPEAPENRAPCVNWRNCRRHFVLHEFDDSTGKRTLISSKPAFEVANGRVEPI